MAHSRTFVIAAAVAIATTLVNAAQTGTGTDAAAFDVVSIKRSEALASGSFYTLPGGRLVMEDGTVGPLIARAFELKSYQIASLPEWTKGQQFTIRTSASGNPTAAQVTAMLQRMLVERFQLAVHHEQRVTTVYVLTLNRSDGRLGPNLAPRTCEAGSRIPFAELTPDAQKRLPASEQARTSVPCGSTTIASGFGLIGFGMKMSALAEAISGYWLGAPVLDRTGLSGGFDITIENIENQWGDRGLRTDGTVSDRPSLPAALQEQLGLKLETRREPFDTLVIDRLERPTED